MIEPTKPPPPPITNLPFQPSGSSSSKFVSVPMTPATLQCGTGTDSCVTDVIRTSGRVGSDSRLHAGARSALLDASSGVPHPARTPIASVRPNTLARLLIALELTVSLLPV
jgi:hypothetical protein